MRKIQVSKFKLYPEDEPTGYAVGFTFSTNGRSGYSDTAVSFDETKDMDNEAVVSVAFGKLEAGIISQLRGFEEKPSVLGQEIEISDAKMRQEPEEETKE